MSKNIVLGGVVAALTLVGCVGSRSEPEVDRVRMSSESSHSEHSPHSAGGGHHDGRHGPTAQSGDEQIDHCVELAKAATSLFTPGCFVCLCRLDHDITVACDTQCWELSKCVHQQCSGRSVSPSTVELCAAERCGGFYEAWPATQALRSISAQCPTLCFPKPPPPPAGAPAPVPMDAGS